MDAFIAARSWPTSGFGFTGLALGLDVARRRHRARQSAGSARRPAASSAQGQERHLDLSLRRLQPPGDVRPQAGPEQIRRQDVRRHAVRQPAQVAAARQAFAAVVGSKRDVYPTILPLQVGFKKHGQAGVEISDWLPHLAGCVDDIAFVRSMYTTDNDHAAEFQMHTGRHALDERQPVIGSWVHYGLGTLNENLPQFVFLGEYTRSGVKQDFRPTTWAPSTPAFACRSTPRTRSPSPPAAKGVLADEQANEFDFINELNGLSAVEYPDDEQLRARIKSYELAFRMQMAVPEVVEPGRGNRGDAPALRHRQQGDASLRPALAGGPAAGRARRAVHAGLPERLRRMGFAPAPAEEPRRVLRPRRQAGRRTAQGPEAARAVGRRAGGLLHRVRPHARLQTSSGGQKDGRDHHPHGFTVWFAGAGIKRGSSTARPTNWASTPWSRTTSPTSTPRCCNLMGLDPRRLEIPGRKRLEIDYGNPIQEIMRKAVVFCLFGRRGARQPRLVKKVWDGSYPPNFHAVVAASLFAGTSISARAAADREAARRPC